MVLRGNAGNWLDNNGYWGGPMYVHKITLYEIRRIKMDTSYYIGGTGKKNDFLDLFRLPRNLRLKLSLDNKTWRKKNREKNDDKYPIFDVEVGQKISLGALFNS